MKTLFLLLTMLSINISLSAQSSKAVFEGEKIVFYGLDFTKAKFSIPDAKPAELKETWFPAWNATVFGDNGRFNKESAFGKVKVSGDPTVVEKRNAAVNVADISGKYEGPLSKEAIAEVISGYKDGLKKEGLGVVLVVENFSKKDKIGIASVVFFDIATRKVLLSKRMTGEPGGGGLNNFWMRTIQQMFEKMSTGEYAKWRDEAK